jgi:glycosyltransferase involved in cell wall biosynthesis
LLEHRSRNGAIKVIQLSRNFGKEAALTAGLDYARGRAVIPIDCDLQDPPELIPDLVEKWGEGYDVVYATREFRQSDDFVKRLTASGYYKVFNLLSDVAIPYDAGDFRILDRRVVDVVRALPERKRFNKGLFAWVGFRQTGIGYHREQRTTGSSKWRPWQLWNFAMDGIFSFSTWPLRIWSYVGFILSSLAIIYAGFLMVRTLVQGIDVPGYASTLVVILFLGGIQLISLGIFGEYLGRIFEEVKQRPLYVVSGAYGISESPPSRYKPSRRDPSNS